MDRWKQLATKYAKYPRKEKVYGFLFGEFNFVNEEIYEAIYNYDVGAMELTIFVKRVYLDVDLVIKATKIPRRGEAMFNSRKPPKLEKNDMSNKICGEKVYVPRNGLKL